MKVKLKEYNEVYDVNAGTEFEVSSQDDGMWSNHPFVSGKVKTNDGHYVYASFDPNDVEEIY